MEQEELLPPGATLAEAKEWLRPRVKGDGARCPCCDQFAKIYQRKLNAAMVRQLMWLVGKFEHSGSWHHCNQEAPAIFSNFQLGTLQHWGLCEQKPNEDDSKKTSGMWRPTAKGIDFAKCKIQVPTHVRIYDNRCIGFTERTTDVANAYGEGFHYGELMHEILGG